MPEPTPHSNQPPFGAIEFAENPEPRCPCVLLLDVSGSMTGEAIEELNAGLVTFKQELMADSLAHKRVEVAVITFGPVQVVRDFQTAEHFQPPTLSAEGDTPMGAAIECALELLRRRKEEYRASGITFYRPWILMITDGAPSDNWAEAAASVQAGEASKSFAFFAIAVRGANLQTLRQISVRAPLRLKGLQFRSMFQWLSNSMKSVSHSSPAEALRLQNPLAPEGWASI